jgi:hypothetical protein
MTLPRCRLLALSVLLLPAHAAAQESTNGGQPSTVELTPGTDVNSHLPSSSRPVTGDGEDGFDLNQPEQGGVLTLGSKNGGGEGEDEAPSGYGTSRKVERAEPAPEYHMVRQGDTLWDISGRYFDNPWTWPQLWSLNPQVENPHWIYPGDQLRMRAPGAAGPTPSGKPNFGASLIARRGKVTGDTIFLRDHGYLGDPERDIWGELVGSAEDQMMLSYGNNVYLLMKDGADVRVGQQLTIFSDVRTPDDVPGARTPPGEIVKVYGTVRVTDWDPETHIARGEIVESTDVIERGARVGPVGRRFQVVPATTAEADVVARVLTSFYPHVYLGQNQLVFLDKGSEDGLKPGNRLKALRRGDAWRRGFTASSASARTRVKLDSAQRAPAEQTPLKGDEEEFPDEIVGEVRVIHTERYSSVALVTEAKQELIPGDRVVSAAGY